ncbi:hypothetical protein ACFT4A_40715 [Streptomyces sp. NPDC057099]|uniref:hypothetical protein n=1 Tax=Streptomyces sp. NPDC057099 TaxID=3346019 RepID=UPI0036369275
MEAETNKLRSALEGLGVTVIPRRLDVPDEYPEVDWEDDQSGFLKAIEELCPTVAYIAIMPLHEGAVNFLIEEYDVEDDPDPSLEPGRQLLREARGRYGEPASVRAAFVHEGAVQSCEIPAGWWSDLWERIDAFMVSQEPTENDRQQAERLAAFEERVYNEWFPLAKEHLLADETYITGKTHSERSSYAKQVLEPVFGDDYERMTRTATLVYVEDERRAIVQRRVQAAEVELPQWAADLAALQAFQVAKTQTARRVLAKQFIAAREPLAVSGERTKRLELLARNGLDHS